jgi:dihydroneopterin aldolase
LYKYSLGLGGPKPGTVTYSICYTICARLCIRGEAYTIEKLSYKIKDFFIINYENPRASDLKRSDSSASALMYEVGGGRRRKTNPSQIVYWPNDVIRRGLNEYTKFPDGLSFSLLEERKVASTMAFALTGIFRDFPTKLIPDFTQELLQVKRNIKSLEEELKVATDRKSIKAARRKYTLDYEHLHDAKQKLTPQLAQECIEHCFEKFREDVRNYRFIVLKQKIFLPRIDEEERESDSEEESSTKWRDRVGSKSS